MKKPIKLTQQNFLLKQTNIGKQILQQENSIEMEFFFASTKPFVRSTKKFALVHIKIKNFIESI